MSTFARAMRRSRSAARAPARAPAARAGAPSGASSPECPSSSPSPLSLLSLLPFFAPACSSPPPSSSSANDKRLLETAPGSLVRQSPKRNHALPPAPSSSKGLAASLYGAHAQGGAHVGVARPSGGTARRRRLRRRGGVGINPSSSLRANKGSANPGRRGVCAVTCATHEGMERWALCCGPPGRTLRCTPARRPTPRGPRDAMWAKLSDARRRALRGRRADKGCAHVCVCVCVCVRESMYACVHASVYDKE